MFVPEDRLKFNLPALVEKAIGKWSESEPLGFTRPVVEECGDFIAAEMDANGLRRLHGDEPWFSDEATAQQYRECVFTALDHWLVKAEISGELATDRNSRNSCAPDLGTPPFSAPGISKTPPVNPYYVFDESWGPTPTVRATPDSDLLVEIDAGPTRQVRTWFKNLLFNLLWGALGGAAFTIVCFGLGFLIVRTFEVPEGAGFGVGIEPWNLPGTILGAAAWIAIIRYSGRWFKKRSTQR